MESVPNDKEENADTDNSSEIITKTRRSSRFNKPEKGEIFYCESCDVSFSEPDGLKNHMKLHKEFGIKVATTTQIKKRKIEDNTKPAGPIIQNDSVVSKKDNKYVNNKGKKLKKTLNCDTCGETFMHIRTLISHKKCVHNEANKENKDPKILLLDNDTPSESNIKKVSIEKTKKSDKTSKNEVKISSRSIFNSEQIQHMKAIYLVNK